MQVSSIENSVILPKNTQKTAFLENIFSKIFSFFLAFLPWSTLISVYFVFGIGASNDITFLKYANILKEIILFVLLGIFVILCFFSYRKNKKFPIQFDSITVSILSYFAIMSLITMFTTGMKGLIFGGRYDFIFLIVFLLLYHGSQFLKYSAAHYIKIFLISAGLMLFVSGLLKFPFSEELLLYVGFSPNASVWDFGGAPPIFHGIHGEGVRRFQGILDNPNAMGAFIIVFLGVFAYFMRYRKPWHFVVGIIAVGLVMMIVYTYSRSALLGVIFGGLVAISGFFTTIFKKHKKEFTVLSILVLLFGIGIYTMFTSRGNQIIGRADSTKGHAERMMVGAKRFIENPIGQGMGSAGPAYRYVQNMKGIKQPEIAKYDEYYIPESWYIQQFIEGGIVGGVLFLVVMFLLFISLYGVSPILGGMFAGVGVMNFFLHTFEASVISFLLFALIGIILGKKLYIDDKRNYLKK